MEELNCSFYQVYVQNKGTVNMTFVDNFAVYGGHN